MLMFALGIPRGEFKVVLASPEAINSDYGSAVIRDQDFKKHIAVVTIDECHCVVQWQVTTIDH